MTIATSMMRSESGLSPVISRSIQMRRLLSCAIILRGISRDRHSVICGQPQAGQARSAKDPRTHHEHIQRAFPARAGHRHRHAPVACAAATFAISRATAPSCRRVRPQITLEAHQKAADYSTREDALRHDPHRRRCGRAARADFGGLLQLLDLGSGWFQSRCCTAPRSSACSWYLALIDLPFSYYRTFNIEARFGFNKMTRSMWLADLVKSAAVGVALGLPLVLAVLWLMGEMGDYWWLYVWLVWVGFSVFMMAIYPAFIAPLFNKFSPMQDGSLKSRIEELLAKCGFRSSGLFVMDGSQRSTHGNAYFTGFGKTKRIVFFDTLISRLNENEIEAVLAHELGHFKLHHVIRRMAWTFAVSLAFLGLLGLAEGRGLVLSGPGSGLSGHQRDGAAAVRAGGAGVHLPAAAADRHVLAQARVRGGRVRRALQLGARAGERAGQAVQRQCLHADARPAALRVLRFASAGQHPHRAAAIDARFVSPDFRGHNMDNVVQDLRRSKCAPCEGGMAPLTPAQIQPMLNGLQGWSVDNGHPHQDLSLQELPRDHGFRERHRMDLAS